MPFHDVNVKYLQDR